MRTPPPHRGSQHWLRLPRRTARLRLTVLYGGAVFLACGATVLAFTYLLYGLLGHVPHPVLLLHKRGKVVPIAATQPAEAAKIDAVPKWDLFGPPNFTMPFNVAGYPAISVCAGFGEGGLPVAIQLVGKPFQEPTLFRVADAFEKATPFRDRRPTLVSA